MFKQQTDDLFTEVQLLVSGQVRGFSHISFLQLHERKLSRVELHRAPGRRFLNFASIETCALVINLLKGRNATTGM